MKKSSAWKMVCIVFMFCAATAIASPAQTLTTLYSFTGGNDGGFPLGPAGAGYGRKPLGTTFQYGAAGSGTVYKLTPSGTLTTLHSFTGIRTGPALMPG